MAVTYLHVTVTTVTYLPVTVMAVTYLHVLGEGGERGGLQGIGTQRLVEGGVGESGAEGRDESGADCHCRRALRLVALNVGENRAGKELLPGFPPVQITG